ncbi:MAG: alpha/beta hydrolase, partial [Chloroflexi bacterium]|nr:alpha/beta hydrolase [Chloroflexota bacterium]
LHYVSGGEGRPLVLVHGSAGSWTHWLRNLAALATVRRVYALDMLGYADSERPARPYGLPDFAALVDEFRQAVVGQPSDLMGFSFGGLISATTAATDPDGIANLVLVAPSGWGKLNAPALSQEQNVPLRGTPEERKRVISANMRAIYVHLPENAQGFALDVHHHNIVRTRVSTRRAISRVVDIFAVLPRIRARTLFVWGQEDALGAPSPQWRAERIRAVLPQAQFAYIDQAGHWVQFEQAEAFNRMVVGFLSTA